MPVLKMSHYKWLSLLLSIIHLLLWASSQLLCTTLFPALQGWKTKVVFNLGDSVTSAELQSWAPWCLSVSQRVFAPHRLIPALMQRLLSGPGAAILPLLLGWPFFPLVTAAGLWLWCPLSLYLIFSAYLTAGFHLWDFNLWSHSLYIAEKGPQHCTCMKLI